MLGHKKWDTVPQFFLISTASSSNAPVTQVRCAEIFFYTPKIPNQAGKEAAKFLQRNSSTKTLTSSHASLEQTHAAHINHGSQTITPKAECSFWVILRSWWMTTSQSNPSACQHHLTEGINLGQPTPLLCFPAVWVCRTHRSFSLRKKKKIILRRHIKAGTERMEPHPSSWLWIWTSTPNFHVRQSWWETWLWGG